MKYYATQEYMPAHAECSPFDQNLRKSPVPLPGEKMDRDSADAMLYRFDILFHPARPAPDLRARPRVISIPYLALSLFLSCFFYPLFSTSQPSGHTLCMARRLVVVREPAEYQRLARLVFGTDHSPLSWRGSGPVLGPRRAERGIRGPRLFSLSFSLFFSIWSTIRIRAAHEENSPVMVPRERRRERKRRDETAY